MLMHRPIMSVHPHAGRVGRILVMSVLGALTTGTIGCSQQQIQEMQARMTPRTEPPDDPNIIGVHKFVAQEPWLSFRQEGPPQVDGIKTTLYLESGTTGKGAFGDGTIRVSMYTVDRYPDGSEHVTRAYQWELTPEQSLPWRRVKETRLGWGYGLHLQWKDVDVADREIELVYAFERRDGRVVSSKPIRLRVPPRATVVRPEPKSPEKAEYSVLKAQ
ncbi:MAG: hypothetical protein L6Q92_02240 [Phycisphaerae bacterium]|nr:hypothetical protein [Phycisphaerae bacterium]